MKPLLDRWIEALRSGDYEQVQSRLKKGTGAGPPGREKLGYCCLGVLCDVLDPDGWDAGEDGDEPNTYTYIKDGFGSFEQLPDPVAHLIGMGSAGETNYPVRKVNVNGVVSLTSIRPGEYTEQQWDDEPYWEALTELNDDAGATFNDIADLLENEFNVLFTDGA